MNLDETVLEVDIYHLTVQRKRSSVCDKKEKKMLKAVVVVISAGTN